MTRINIAAGVSMALLGFGACAGAQAAAITDWDFASLSGTVAAPDNSPAPTTGAGTASTLGMTNNYTYSSGGATGCTTGCVGAVAGDDITTDNVNGTSATSDVWRVRGQNNSGADIYGNGWNNAAPEYTQGVQFGVNTTGYDVTQLQFTWTATTQGVGNMQVQYTTDGSTWNNIGGVINAVVASSTVPYETDTINLAGIGAASNDPNFGIRLVSAYNPTLGDEYASATSVVAGSPVQYNNASGNWRFADVQIDGTASPVPLPATAWLLLSGMGGLGVVCGRRRRAS